MITALTVVLVLTSLLLILLILLHKGRGGGLSDMFGGGMSSGSVGPRLPNATWTASPWGAGIIWFACVIALGLLLKVNA